MAVGLIKQKIEAGVLYFYEKTVGRSATGDVLSISPTAGLTVGGTSQTLTNAIAFAGTFTNGLNLSGACTTGLVISGATTTALSLSGTATDGLAISGVCADAIHISGANTAAGLHISGDQVDAVLIDVDAAANNGVKIAVDDGITVGTALNIVRTGTTGIATTAISIDTDGTTGIAITSGFTGTTGISIAGTASGDGILVSGACADGIHISGTNTATGLHISGDQVDAILIDGDAAADNGIRILVDDGITIGTGINIDRTGTTGICTTAISIDTDGTTGIDIAAGFTGTTGISFAGTASGDGILISGACADGIHISGTNTATGLHISGDQVDAILIDGDAAADNGIRILVDDGITIGTGINIDRTGTTGICTTAISIDTDGTTGIAIAAGFTGVTGISIAGTASTAAISISGANATGLSFTAGSSAALINANAAAVAASVRGIFIGEDANVIGSGIPLNGASWATSQANAFYSDDGGVAATGYTETMTVRHLMTVNVTTGDVSFTPMHTDLYLNASYTGSGGLSSIWGNTTVVTGKTIDTSGGLGDVGGATFGLDLPTGAILAASSFGCGVSVGGNLGGTHTGIVTAYRVRNTTAGNWDGFLSIGTSGGPNGCLQGAAAGVTNDQFLKVYVGTTLYTIPMYTA